jgi:nicotinamidase-related amidase
MNSSPKPRDPARDQLLTPQNAALLVIDYQPTQVRSIQSRDRRSLVSNAVAVVRLARLFALPIVLSTVNVANGRNAPTIPSIANLLPDVVPIDRTTINAWEDEEFVRAVKAAGRQNLLMLALWTEACLTFPALDALRDGYRVYPVVDAVGGTSLEAHDAALQRVVQAGAHPVSWVQLACELQRDWARETTVKGFADILFSL